MVGIVKPGRYRLKICHNGLWEPTCDYFPSVEEAIDSEVKFLRTWAASTDIPEPGNVAETLLGECLLVFDDQARRMVATGIFVATGSSKLPILEVLDSTGGVSTYAIE